MESDSLDTKCIENYLKAYKSQVSQIAEITKTLSSSFNEINKALSLNEEETRSNKAASSKKENEGKTTAGVRIGVEKGMNALFIPFLKGKKTSNQLIKGIFHNVQAQLEAQFTKLLSDTVTNSLMGIFTPLANTLDKNNFVEPLLKGIQSKAIELGNMLDTNIFAPLITDVSSIFKDVGAYTKSSILDPLLNNMSSMLSNLSGFLYSNILSPLMEGVKSIFGHVGNLLSGVMADAGSWANSLVSMTSGLFFADGGHVRGAGTETSDSIPAMLSNNEFVTRAAVVKQPGMLPFLHDINSRGVAAVNDYARRFRHANGGVAGSPSSLVSPSFNRMGFSENNSSATTVENAVNLHVYDDPQRIINSSFSDSGMESYYLKIERNPQRLKSILGV